jgi:hypothetical protein
MSIKRVKSRIARTGIALAFALTFFAVPATLSLHGSVASAADSTATLPDVLDTWENSLRPTTNYDSDTNLQAGTSPYGNQTRSYLKFDASAIKYHPITSATLNLWQNGSANCNGQLTDVVGAGQLQPGTTWNTMPGTDNHIWGWTYANVGSQCGTSGGVNIDITALVQAWAQNSEPTYETLALVPGNETLPAQWKMYYSADTFLAPHITVTYGPLTNNVVCKSGTLGSGDNIISVSAGQGVTIKIVNAGLLPNVWTVYDALTPGNLTQIGSLYILPQQTKSVDWGRFGNFPVPYKFDLYTSSTSVLSNYSILSYRC